MNTPRYLERVRFRSGKPFATVDRLGRVALKDELKRQYGREVYFQLDYVDGDYFLYIERKYAKFAVEALEAFFYWDEEKCAQVTRELAKLRREVMKLEEERSGLLGIVHGD